MHSNSSTSPAASTASLGSVDPARAGGVALTDRAAEATRGSRREVTTALPPLSYAIPTSLEEILQGTGSFAGYSAVSTFLECPERSRLKWRGVRKKGRREPGMELSAMALGSVAHALRAVRIVHGPDTQRLLLSAIAPDLHPDDVQQLDFMFRVYDQLYPWGSDPWTVIGVEVEVISDVRKADAREPVLRSVRYDTVVRYPDGDLYSFEAKTASRSGSGALDVYNPQGMSQCALWNANEVLVRDYGEMKGVLFDHMIKTKTPSIERHGPRYFSRRQQQMALSYLRLPEHVVYPMLEDGKYPKMLHACWGRFSACEMLDLCHEDAWGDYAYVDGRAYDGA